MPKKTRQEKILVQLRRLQQQTNREQKVSLDKVPSISSIIKPLQPEKITSIKTEIVDYSYVFSDLRKTLSFAFGAIIFELVLSLTALGSYVKLFFRLL